MAKFHVTKFCHSLFVRRGVPAGVFLGSELLRRIGDRYDVLVGEFVVGVKGDNGDVVGSVSCDCLSAGHSVEERVCRCLCDGGTGKSLVIVVESLGKTSEG